MPYLLIYYEKTLGMDNYTLIFAPAILLAAVITVFYGRLYDRIGFMKSIMPVIAMLLAGYMILYFTTTTVPVFIGSLLMMAGYLTGMSVFGAMIRDSIPEGRAGQFQGVRIIGQVFVPGLIGPALGAWILRDADVIVNGDGTTSFLPDRGIWSAAAAVIVILFAVLMTTKAADTLPRSTERLLRSTAGHSARSTLRMRTVLQLSRSTAASGSMRCTSARICSTTIRFLCLHTSRATPWAGSAEAIKT